MTRRLVPGRARRWLAFCLVGLWLAVGAGGCASPADAVAPATPCPPGPSVVIVVVDGARYEETLGDPTLALIPRIGRELAPAGTTAPNFVNAGLTETLPGHAAILTGTWQPISNLGTERPTRPTLFEYQRAASGLPAHCVVLVGGKAKLAALTHSTHPDYGAGVGALADVADRTDQATWAALRARLDADHPRLVLLSLSEVDRAGHTGDVAAYREAIQNADRIVAAVWAYLRGSDAYRFRSALIVTNDHGRSATDLRVHAGDEHSRLIMLVAAGTGVPAGVMLAGEHTQLEVAPTVGVLLGIATPGAGASPLPGLAPIASGPWRQGFPQVAFRALAR